MPGAELTVESRTPLVESRIPLDESRPPLVKSRIPLVGISANRCAGGR